VQREAQEKDDHYTNQIEELVIKLSKAERANKDLRDKNTILNSSLQEARDQLEAIKERGGFTLTSKSNNHRSKKSNSSIQSHLATNAFLSETPILESAKFAAAFSQHAADTQDDRVQQLEAEVRELRRVIEELREEEQAHRNNSSQKYQVIEHSFEKILEHRGSDKTFRSIRHPPRSDINDNGLDIELHEGEEEDLDQGEEEQSQNNSVVDLSKRDPDVFWSNLGQNTAYSNPNSRRATDLAQQAPLLIEPRSEAASLRQSFVEPRDEVDKPSELDGPHRKDNSPLLLDPNGLLNDQEGNFEYQRALFLMRNSNSQRSGDLGQLKKNQADTEQPTTLKTHKSVKCLKTRPSIALLRQKARMFANQYKKNKLQKSEVPDYSRDYLGVTKIKKLSDYLKKLEDHSSKLFSDAVSLYAGPHKKQKYIFIVTCNRCSPVKYILLIVPGTVEKIKSLIELSSIQELILPEKSQVQLVLKSRTSSDMIVECFRRFELIRFLHQVCDSKAAKRFPITLSSKYVLLKQLLDEHRGRQSGSHDSGEAAQLRTAHPGSLQDGARRRLAVTRPDSCRSGSGRTGSAAANGECYSWFSPTSVCSTSTEQG